MSMRFEYIPSFDGVRGIAVLFVLLLHGSYGFFAGGWIGVDLFFVLSGYLITSMLQSEHGATGRVSIGKFYARRALRLLPALLIGVAIANLLWRYADNLPQANRFQATLASLFYFANFVPGAVLGPLSHLWSLAVEEHFYLLWPVLLSVVLFRIPIRRRLALLAILIATAGVIRILVFRLAVGHVFTAGPIVVDSYRFSLCRMDAILMGAFLAIAVPRQGTGERQTQSDSRVLWILLAFLSGWVLLVNFDNPYWCCGGFILTNFVCLGIVAIAARNPEHPLLNSNALRWIGRRAYGIYLYHFPVFLALEVLRTKHSISNFILVTLARFALTLLVAEVSFRFIERPILKYKRRYQLEAELAPTGA